MECNAMECNGMEWNLMEWNGMEWNGMQWNGMECNGNRIVGRIGKEGRKGSSLRAIVNVSDLPWIL